MIRLRNLNNLANVRLSARRLPKLEANQIFAEHSTDPSGNSITFDRDARSLKRQSKQIFTMEQYTPRERYEIVDIYIQQNKSIVKTQRAFKKLKNVKSVLV